ncbi:MAG: hypothetical protein M1826_002295 [Phylliscum demangeonii]|nr:MAG: hypothetical protein M1826_002295 [Phylliscum demangeonii]
MALNGLSSPQVNEAYLATVSEPGGWFLLKYMSRDELDILARGTGGIAELRPAVAAYTELSPLYGFLRFRRRNVLVRYVPKDTSRLLQARVTVHFQIFVDRFSPHDAIFALTDAAELKDASLSAACSLHAASGSTSSTTSSMQKKRLGEIVEDAEEVRTPTAESFKPLPPLPFEQARIADRPSEDDSARVRVEAEDARRPRPSTSNTTTTTPEPERPSSASTLPVAAGARPPSADGGDGGRRSRAVRPGSRDPFQAPIWGVTPKVKLGPRPAARALDGPHASGPALRSNAGRPVSSLPAGVRTAPRKTPTSPTTAALSHARPSQPPFSLSLPPIPQVSNFSDVPLPQLTSLLPTLTPTLTSTLTPLPSPTDSLMSTSRPRAPTITPERQRLMKALELRKKQKMRQAQEAAAAKAEALARERAGQAASTTGHERDSPRISDDTESVASLGPVSTRSGAMEDASPYEAEGSPTFPPLDPSTAKQASRASRAEGDVRDEAIDGPSSSRTSQLTELAHSVAPDEGRRIERDPMSTVVLHEDDSTRPVHEETAGKSPPGKTASSPVSSHHSPDPTSTVASSFSEDGDPPSSGSLDGPMSSAATDPKTLIRIDTGVPSGHLSPMFPTASSGLSEEGVDAHPEAAVTEAAGPRVAVPEPASLMPFSMALSTVDRLDGDMAPAEARTAPDDTSRRADPGPAPPSTAAAGANSRSDSLPASHRHSRRRSRLARGGIVVDPIRTDLSADNSDDNMLSDDSLIDELHGATVHEAKQVSVAKTPVLSQSPSRGPHGRDTSLGRRAMSMPLATATATTTATAPAPAHRRSGESDRAAKSSAGDGSGLRSSSLSILSGGGGGGGGMATDHGAGADAESGGTGTGNGDGNGNGSDDGRREKAGPITIIKTINVSSGISQRIKALERVSSQRSRPLSPHGPPLSSSSAAAGSPSRTVSPTFARELRKASLASMTASTTPARSVSGSVSSSATSPHLVSRGAGGGGADAAPHDAAASASAAAAAAADEEGRRPYTASTTTSSDGNHPTAQPLSPLPPPSSSPSSTSAAFDHAAARPSTPATITTITALRPCPSSPSVSPTYLCGLLPPLSPPPSYSSRSPPAIASQPFRRPTLEALLGGGKRS